MQRDLTKGSITKTMLAFAVPMIAGNLHQQFYNITDTLIVGRFLGTQALAAVGSAYTLLTFLTSILIGLCMGSASIFSIRFGEKDDKGMKESMVFSFVFISIVTTVILGISFVFTDPVMRMLQVPAELYDMMRSYLRFIFWGIGFIFFYNYFSFLLRSVGNSMIPLCFLAVSALLNIVLDLVFVLSFRWGVEGAAAATVIAQGVSGVGIGLYTVWKEPLLRISREDIRFRPGTMKEIFRYSFLTCIQQSVMNFGILMVQGLVNSFGPAVMAAFAAAVKIDTFAYMPAQEFGNAFSIFTAQSYGAREKERIRQGIKHAVGISVLFCAAVSAAVCIFAEPLMMIFIDRSELEIIAIGVQYLRTEGIFYCGIGCLFLLYGYYRAVEKPMMSVVLTVISLGTRVGLAYTLASVPAIGVSGIWWSIPIGWFLADVVGIVYYLRKNC